MVATATTTVTIVRGDHWTLPMQWRAPSGTGINIEGVRVYGALVLRTETLPLGVDNQRVEIVDMAEGRWQYHLTEEETAALPAGMGLSFRVSIVRANRRTTLAILPINIV